MAIKGRTVIEQNRLETLAIIETNRKTALAKLSIQYANADQVKNSFGYIGIIFFCLLWGGFILNDLPNIVQYCYGIAKDQFRESRERKEKEIKENETTKHVNLQMEELIYLQELNNKFDNIHYQLVKACAKRRANEHRENKRL